MLNKYDEWSRAKQAGYDDYYSGLEPDDNPYESSSHSWEWNQWCDGHMEAYVEDEGK